MRIRKHTLTGIALLSIACATVPAHAQMAVFDSSNYAQALQQLRSLQQQYTTLQSQLTQAQQTYQSITHLPDQALQQAQSQLNTQQFRNPLGTSSMSVSSIMNGSSLGSGALGSVGQSYLNQNRVYSPTGSDFQAQQMNRNATSIAGSQAVASELYQSSASHMQTLQGLEGQLASAPDTKAVADVQARIQMEQASFQAQQVQAQSLAMWQQSQERNQDQRNDEARRQQIDNLIEQAKAHGG